MARKLKIADINSPYQLMGVVNEMSDQVDALVAAQPGKADLGANGYVVSSQIDPFQNKQTGFRIEGERGCYRSTNTALRTPGSITGILIFTTGSNMTNNTTLIDKRGDGDHIRVDINAGRLYVPSFGTEGTRLWAISPNTQYCLAIKYDSEAGTVRIILNNSLLNELPATYQAPLYCNVGAYSTSMTRPFSGAVNSYREFNAPLSDEEIGLLWNKAQPAKYHLSDGLRSKCVAEFRAESLTTDNWINLANPAASLPFVIPAGYEAKAILTYDDLFDFRELIFDTGLFVTNIASSAKAFTIPQGYAVDAVYAQNFNTGGITAFRAYWVSNNVSIVASETISGDAALLGRMVSFPVGKNYMPNGADSMVLAVTATGNGASGGLRVIIKFKWIGL